MTARIWVAGIPAAKGSVRAFPNRKTGGVIVTHAGGKNLKTWEATIRFAVFQAGAVITNGPVCVSLRFYLPRAKKPPLALRNFPAKRPDLDKLIRAVLDALTGVAFLDDSQVICIEASKVYGDPGVEIEVRGVNGLGERATQ